MRKKAQVSIEYTMVIGLVILTLTISVAVAYYYSSTARGQIRMNQLDKIGKKIADTSDSIYYLGPPSKATIELTMPDQVKSIELFRPDTGNNYIQFVYHGAGGDAISIYYIKGKFAGSDQPLNDSRFRSPGLKRLTISAVEEGGTKVSLSTSYT